MKLILLLLGYIVGLSIAYQLFANLLESKGRRIVVFIMGITAIVVIIILTSNNYHK